MGYEVPVEQGKIRELARALGATDPAHEGPAAVIPPTFLTTAQHWQPPGDPLEQLGFDPSRILHAGEEYLFPGPLPRAGDRLVVEARIEQRWERAGRRGGRLRFACIVREFRSPDRTLVAVQRSTVVETERPPGAPA